MAGTTRRQRVEDLVGILRCPACHGDVAPGAAAAGWTLPGIALSGTSLACVACGEEYPVTEEGIPIMWTPGIMAYLGGRRGGGALSANIEVYDETSDHYLVHVRKSDQARDRVMACVAAVSDGLGEGWHVDFGCGPGHVLIWSGPWAAARGMRQVGLDVSIQNLRNVLQSTDAFAVLGDAVDMPFRDGVAALVTEASVLHHIEDWRASIREASRVARADGGAIVFDNEPTRKSLDWSATARFVFESRFWVYKLLSYVMPSKRGFRNMRLAKLNYYGAEVHNQPGRGFDPDAVRQAFAKAGRDCTIYFRMGATLGSGTGRNSPQLDLLLRLSGKDLSDPEHGVMTMVAR